jgi:D-serine deaminase-like pyridoxal phosphate-dependent protein
MSDDVPCPFPQCVAHVESVRLSAEHAILTLSQASAVPRVGDRVTFEVGYSDSTILLHDEIHALRDGVPAAVWPVGGRGKAR